MKIQLDHVQRLNLHALLGAQRGDLATIRALWTLQDKLALTPEEETAIQLRREVVAGHERVVWNPDVSIQSKQLDLTEADLARIRAALEAWIGYWVTADRGWLEPLLVVLGTAPKVST